MDVSAAKDHLRRDPRLLPLVEQVHLPERTEFRGLYIDLLDSIVSQQLSGKVATVIFNRFLNLFPNREPHAELLAALDLPALRTVGLSQQKASYLINVAQFALQNDLENHPWHDMSDDEIVAFLTQIKGVGRWTVEMLLMFSLQRPDIFPIDDLGIRQAMILLFNFEETGKALKDRMIACAEPWRPFRTLASRYLWRFKDAYRISTDGRLELVRP